VCSWPLPLRKVGHGASLPKGCFWSFSQAHGKQENGGGKIGCHIASSRQWLLTAMGFPNWTLPWRTGSIHPAPLENTDGLGGIPIGHDRIRHAMTSGSLLSKHIFPGIRHSLKTTSDVWRPEPHFLEMHSGFNPVVSLGMMKHSCLFTCRFIRPAKNNVRVCQRTIGDEVFVRS